MTYSEKEINYLIYQILLLKFQYPHKFQNMKILKI